MMALSEASVPAISLAFMFVTLLITLVLPFVIWFILARKYKGITSAIIAGMIGFYIPQIIVRFTLLQILGTLPLFVEFATNNIELYALFLGFTAAFFETVGRVLVFYFLRKKLSYKLGLGAGFGHGAIEAMYLVGLTYINNIIIAVMLNMQGIDGLIATLGSTDIAEQVALALTQTAPVLYLVAALERICTVFLHIALSLIICYGFTAKKLPLCILITMLWHTGIDTISVVLSSYGVNTFIIELAIIANAIVAVIVIIKIKGKFDVKEIPHDEAEKALEEGY